MQFDHLDRGKDDLRQKCEETVHLGRIKDIIEVGLRQEKVFKCVCLGQNIKEYKCLGRNISNTIMCGTE